METVKVVAPATLSEGYTFDAVVDGRTVMVTVPTGGVKEGEAQWQCSSEWGIDLDLFFMRSEVLLSLL